MSHDPLKGDQNQSIDWQDRFFLRNPDGSLDTFRLEETFPKLSDEMIEAIRPFGEELELPAGQVLYQRGDRNVDFYVVLRGEVEAFGTDNGGKEHALVIFQDRNFSGELTQFSNQKSLSGGRTSMPSSLLRVRHRDFRRMVAGEPELGELILRAFILRRSSIIRHQMAGVTLIGAPRDPDLLRIRQFLTRNGYPHQVLPPDAPGEGGGLLVETLSLASSDLPVVLFSKERLLKNPGLSALASELGLLEEVSSDRIYDVAIVGAGPAGLAASVYAASEGLDTILLEAIAPGGQAGTSSRIENYLGFPNGISGQDLAARAGIQAVKFGVHLMIARCATHIARVANDQFEIGLDDRTRVRARAVIVASGAKYRKLDLTDYERFEGRGIQYAATAMEAQLCAGEEVVVIGGGNSAGQAVLFLCQSTSKVHMLVRGKALSETMSRYLVERIEASANIQIHYETKLSGLSGKRSLEQVEWRDPSNDQPQTRPIRHVFVMIGAIPNTDWLKGCIELDPKGFIPTGKTSTGIPTSSPYETTEPGVYAIGDVRADSVKRMASAVGEGSVVVQWVHQYLVALREPATRKAA
jgi:thioredoxin reductase (NADPH)